MFPRTPLIALSLALALVQVPDVRAADDGGLPPAAVTESAATGLPAAATAAPGAATAAGQAPAALDGDEVIVTAERLERSGLERVVVGEGAVTILHRDMRMVADRVVYNEQTKQVVADGNIVLDIGPDRLQGEHLELNFETRVGFLERAQGFLQTYYFKGDRLEKLGPDHYYLSGGSFTTCEGTKPDWSFSATTTEVTIDEYLHAWNPTLRIKRVPVLWFPYAVFPVKRERSTGLLIPVIGFGGVDGFTVRNAFYWAPRDNLDATVAIDYLEKTGWGAGLEMRYLLAPRTQGVVTAYYERNTDTDGKRWSLSTRNSQELPFGIHAEIDAFFQSDREFIATQGNTIEERSNERTSSSFFLNRSWSSWNFALSGRSEVSLITEERTTLTRFPELTIDRTSTRLFGTDLFLKVAASAVDLKRDDSTATVSTTRLHVSPEMTWPLSIGAAARIIPSAGYALTYYSENTLGAEETRSLPYFELALEGPRPYRIWDLDGDGRYAKLKHLIEPRISYVYTPEVDQENLPRFDSIDQILPANRIEYSLTNTLFARVRGAAAPAPIPAAAASPGTLSTPLMIPADAAAGGEPGEPVQRTLLGTTQELLRIKLSQNYTFDEGPATEEAQDFSAVEWEARARPATGLEFLWRGNFDLYGNGVGYQNISLTWRAGPSVSFRGDWRTTRDSTQDFLDLGVTFPLGRVGIDGRSRYNLAEDTFVENRIGIKYTSQCWDVTLGYVHWTDSYEYTITFGLKGIGTVVKI